MGQKPKPPSSRGQLNIGLNALVSEGVILRYDIQMSGGATTIEVAAQSGSDQAVVVKRVRDILPTAFAGAQVRTLNPT